MSDRLLIGVALFQYTLGFGLGFVVGRRPWRRDGRLTRRELREIRHRFEEFIRHVR